MKTWLALAAGAALVGASLAGPARAVDSGGCPPSRLWEHPGPWTQVAVSASGEVAAVTADWKICKLDAGGALLWTRSRAGMSGVPARGIAFDPSGNVLVTGTENAGVAIYNWLTQKYDGSGNLLWEARYTPGNAWADAVAVDTAGNVLVSGAVWSGTTNDWAVIKYDAGGVQQWAATYDGPASGADVALAVAADASGNVLAGGYETTADGPRWAVRKYDAGGGFLWSRTAAGGSTAPDAVYRLATGPGDCVYALGITDGNPVSYDAKVHGWAQLRKYASDGSDQWAFADLFGIPDSLCLAATGEVVFSVVNDWSPSGWRVLGPGGDYRWSAGSADRSLVSDPAGDLLGAATAGVRKYRFRPPSPCVAGMGSDHATIHPNPVDGDAANVRVALGSDGVTMTVEVFNSAYRLVHRSVRAGVSKFESGVTITGLRAWARGTYLVRVTVTPPGGAATRLAPVTLQLK